MIKIQTDPRVYAVSNGGVLRWVKTEAIAQALYDIHWAQMIDDVSDVLFINYTVGTPIESTDDFHPSQAMSNASSIYEDQKLKQRSSPARTQHVVSNPVTTPSTNIIVTPDAQTSTSLAVPRLLPPASPAIPSTPPFVTPNFVVQTWKTKIDSLLIPGFNKLIDSEGNYVYVSERYRAILPPSGERSDDFAKFLLNQLKVCSKQIQSTIGQQPYTGDVIATKYFINPPFSGSSCCGPAPEHVIYNAFPNQEAYETFVFSDDAFWKKAKADYSICLSGHEEVHRFFLDTGLSVWFNEGLAQFIEERFRGKPGATASKNLESCVADGFYTVGNVLKNMFRKLDTSEFNQEPRINSYYTAACFWDYIERTYGLSKLQEIVKNLYALASTDRKWLFIEYAVFPAVGNDIREYLRNMLSIVP